MSLHGDRNSGGAAKRRRERRLRMHWRHEQLALQMVLATVELHSHGAPRGQSTVTMTRAEERETYSAPRRQEPPLPAVTTGTQYFTMDDESVPVTGLRPASLAEPQGAQERVQRHTMEQFGELAPMVQILDAPVPQMVDKLEDVLKIVDLSVPVQEIEVPKISSLSCPPPRCFLPQPQSAEQLVEVPTVLSPTRIAEQIVDTPVPQGRGKRRVQGFLPVQGSTATLSSAGRISEQIVEQLVDIPSSGGGLGQGSASSAGAADEDFTGFFALFPMEKSARCRAGGECAAGWARQLIHGERSSNGSCRRARELRRFHRVGAGPSALLEQT